MSIQELSSFKGIIDTTLREGWQFTLANFSPEAQERIAFHLSQIGVDRIEVANPLVEVAQEGIERIRSLPARPPLVAHVRNRPEDVRAAIELRVEGVHILCIGNEERLGKMGMSFEDHLNTLGQTVSLAQKNGLEVRVGVEHFFDHTFAGQRAREIIRYADSLGVDRVSLPDTRGVVDWRDIGSLIADVRREIAADIEVHFHDDFNAIKAYEATRCGANWVDCTLGGIGERRGITPLSSFAEQLFQRSPEVANKYNFDFLTVAEQYVFNLLGIPVPFPLITSPYAFAHKAGIHVDGVRRNGPDLYESIPPETVGNTRHLVVGTPISGRTTREEAWKFYSQYGGKDL